MKLTPCIIIASLCASALAQEAEEKIKNLRVGGHAEEVAHEAEGGALDEMMEQAHLHALNLMDTFDAEKDPLAAATPFDPDDGGDHKRNLQTTTYMENGCAVAKKCEDGLCFSVKCCGTTASSCSCGISVNGNACQSCTICSNDNIGFDCSNMYCGSCVGLYCSGDCISESC